MSLDRRRFLALATVSGAAVAVSRDADAAASPWHSGSWTHRTGTTISATDSLGNRHALRVHGVRVADAHPGTTGESFTVTFTANRPLTDGTYRLRGDRLATTAYLGATGHERAVLVVNALRPAGRAT